MSGRYDTTGNPEDEYYSGTGVLVNAENIRDADELLARETELFVATHERLFTRFDPALMPDLDFLYALHREALAPLYPWWAGRPRTVGIAKGGTPFCPPQNISDGSPTSAAGTSCRVRLIMYARSTPCIHSGRVTGARSASSWTR